MAFSIRGCVALTAVVVSCFCLTLSFGKDMRQKRSADSLYDNIYSAISEFSDDNSNSINTNNNEAPIQKRQIQGNQNFQPGRTRQVVVDGFPAGLPEGTPLGVSIALASLATLPPGEMPPIPGVAGVDYPTLTSVPDTGFDCNQQQYLPGIYGDQGASCQAFYMCQADGNFNGFLCPNGTVFNQQYFICDWWYNVDCGATSNFYSLNAELYKDQPEDGSQFNSNSLGSQQTIDTFDTFNGNSNSIAVTPGSVTVTPGSLGRGALNNNGNRNNLNGNGFNIANRNNLNGNGNNRNNGNGNRNNFNGNRNNNNGNRNNNNGGNRNNNNGNRNNNNNNGGNRNNNNNNNLPAYSASNGYGIPQASPING